MYLACYKNIIMYISVHYFNNIADKQRNIPKNTFYWTEIYHCRKK